MIRDLYDLIPRTRLSDRRGWFLKLMTGFEPGIAGSTGEVYLVVAAPGETRGGHYHCVANEWFTVIRGRAAAVLADPVTGEAVHIDLNEEHPETLAVPAGIAHSFVNYNKGSELWIVAYSDHSYDPEDTIPYDPDRAR